MSSPIHNAGPYGQSSSDLLRAIAGCEASGRSLALLVVQIDELEKVEVALGYGASKALAGDFCARVREVLRDDDQLLQVGDRKFWVILKGVRNQGHAELAASKFARIGKGPFRVDSHSLKLDTVIGIAMFLEHATDADELSRRADMALGRARDNKLPVCIYSDDSTRQMANLWEIEHELDRALEGSEFELHYQPKMDLRSLLPC